MCVMLMTEAASGWTLSRKSLVGLIVPTRMHFLYQWKGGDKRIHVIEVFLQFDLHPINVPGIAFAPPKKIGFSG